MVIIKRWQFGELSRAAAAPFIAGVFLMTLGPP